MAADAAIAKSMHEKAAFLACHSFESTGGAFCFKRGIKYHPASHALKMDLFVMACRRERFAKKVASLAAIVKSLRNSVLYPRKLSTGTIQYPENVISEPQSRRLIGRVRALMIEIKPKAL